jgi:hypothetical protein
LKGRTGIPGGGTNLLHDGFDADFPVAVALVQRVQTHVYAVALRTCVNAKGCERLGGEPRSFETGEDFSLEFRGSELRRVALGDLEIRPVAVDHGASVGVTSRVAVIVAVGADASGAT